MAMEELMITSPTSRGLCKTCARYNWTYHLTRHLPDQKRDALFHHEDLQLRQAIKGGKIAYTKKVGESHNENWYCIDHAPYSGVYDTNEAGDSTWFNLGPLKILSSSLSRCSFCKILLQATQHMDLQRATIAHVSCYFADPQKNINHDPYILIIYLQEKKWKKTYPYGLRLALLGTEETEVFTRSNPNPMQIDPKLLHIWTKTCEKEHGSHCIPLTTGSHIPKHQPNFEPAPWRVLDVKTDRVIRAPENCRYIALSYVWGGITPFRLQKANLTVREAGIPHGHFSAQLDRQKLPRTIQDAMVVVKLLGERYLWVDSLCIVQDDSHELRQNIHNMDRIYSAAALTIIAASGGDANAGLPGLDPGTRYLQPITGSVEGVGLVEVEPPLMLGSSIWASRAWTYQEYQLSAKTIIFTNQRVYYQCNRGFWGEVRPNKLVPEPSKTYFANYSLHVESEAGKYLQHVKEYSSRTLTHEEDVLKAFQAIMDAYSAQHNTRFCWGLPLKHFSQSFLWVNGLYYERDIAPLRRRGHGWSSTRFPSWSWAGWVGGVDFDLVQDPLSFSSKIKHVITWPWDTKYDILATSNPFKTGILTIRVELAVLDITHLSPADMSYCRFDDESMENSRNVECFLVGTISEEFKVWKTNDSVRNDHIVLAVNREMDGIYYRKGLMRIPKQCWATLDCETRCIQLG